MIAFLPSDDIETVFIYGGRVCIYNHPHTFIGLGIICYKCSDLEQLFDPLEIINMFPLPISFKPVHKDSVLRLIPYRAASLVWNVASVPDFITVVKFNFHLFFPYAIVSRNEMRTVLTGDVLGGGTFALELKMTPTD